MNVLRPDWLAARAAALARLSPYYFLRDLPAALQQAQFGVGAVQHFGQQPAERVLAPDADAQWLLRQLPWDSDYFGVPTHQLVTGLFAAETAPAVLRVAAQALGAMLDAGGNHYAFGVVPAEDTALLQALTGAGWELIETRLTYYHDAVAAFAAPRHGVRVARPDEAAAIGRISSAARNPYDRFHADPWFGPDRGDAFLARYAAAAVEVFCDAVLVPDEAGLPVDSFLAISDLLADARALGVGLARVALTAVGPLNRGWHLRLVSETVHRARERGARYVLMTTQATNGAVFRTCEKLGFKLGGCAHVLARRHGPDLA